MRRQLFSLTVTTLAVWWSLALVAAEIPPSEQQLADIDAAIEQVEAWLAQANRQRPQIEQQLQAVDERLADISQQVEESRQSIQETRSRLADLQRQQQDLEKRKQRQSEIIAQLVKAAYLEGSHSPFMLLLNQQDPAEAARMFYYYRLLQGRRREKIQEYEQTLTNLDSTFIQVEETNKALIKENGLLAEQLAELELEKQTRQQTLLALDASISDRDAELQKLKEDRSTLESLLEEVRRAVENVPVPGTRQPFDERQGELTWPGNGPLASRFGERYGNGELQRQGIVISADPGDPVRAVHSGRVVFANWLRGSGLLIILDHGGNYMSLYGYNETLTREPGSWVNAGEIIATVGNSGGQQRAGIYFEIRHNGQPVNPLDWLEPEN